VALPEDMLFVELVKVVDHWLLCSGIIGNKPRHGLGWLVVGDVKGKMANVAGGGELIP
jgi:hypothetical protein